MRTSKFTVEQITHALRREGGVAVVEICRELGIPRSRLTGGNGSTTGSARQS
jgi:hypothetical protein